MMKDNVVKEFTHAGRTVKVVYDIDPINPRTEYENLTAIAHWHRRYDLGERISPCTEEEMCVNASESGDPILAILPLGLYDHSGLSVNNSPSRGWDSGQVGWIYIPQSLACKMGCVEAGWTEEKYLNAIQSDTKVYDDYLGGRVYGYVIEGADGEMLESVWGFIGDIDNVVSEAKATAEVCDDPAVMRACEALEARATYAGV